MFLPRAALSLIQTTAAAPLLPHPQGSGPRAGLEGAPGNPSTKPRAPRAWTGTGLGTYLGPWGMLVSAGSIQGQSVLWSCLHDTLKQSSHCTWSSEFQSPIKLPPRTVKTLSKLVTNVKYPAPAPLRGEELKQHFPHAPSPTEFRFFQLLPSPSPCFPSPDPSWCLLPGRQQGNLFETPSPRTCRCRMPNPPAPRSQSKVKMLLNRCRHGERQQAQDSLNSFHWDPIKTLAVAGLPAGNPISQK